MSTLSQTTIDPVEIDGKTIGLLKPDKKDLKNVQEELAHMNARLATRDEASKYSKEQAGNIGSTAETRKFAEDTEGKVNEPIVFAIREDWYILGYLSDVGEDMAELEYQGMVIVTEE